MRLFLLFVALAFTQASVAFASQFVPIAPLPNPGGGGLATSGTLSQYVNALFRIAIGVGATLAVIFIAIGGFEYIFSEAMDTKKNGRTRITQALLGLGILLIVTLVLFIINPDLISLKALE